MIRENDLYFSFLMLRNICMVILKCEKDIKYDRDVNARLDLISKFIDSKKFLLILTHVDKLTDKDADVNEIINQISNKSYGKLAKYYYPVNMMDEGEKENLKNKIFGA
jgi:archaellum biogenesis protein FlaJ (TadC family)